MADQTQLDALTSSIAKFAAARDWDQFHTPRNLVLALLGEAGELAAEFQWVDDSSVQAALSDHAKFEAVRSELADVLIYLLRLSDVLDIDLVDAAASKISENERRYPAEEARGSAAKYTAYE